MAAPISPAICALCPQACAAPVVGSASGWPRSGGAGHVGPHARHRQAGPRAQAELGEPRCDERRGARLLEAELGMAADRLADFDDLVGVALDRFVDPLLELVASHGMFSSPARRAWRRI
jgi:hypothetical protein